MIPYGRQSIDDDDIEAVVKVLRGDWLTQGPAVEAFEDKLAAITEARYAVAFSSGTAALHAACAAGGVGPGWRVATSPLTFVASANCARFVGADVEFADIDPATLNLDPRQVPAGIDALVAVHFAGLPVALELLPERPAVVIEDAAHAIGARTNDGPVGCCARSDMTTFSFHPVKTVTSGEGGAVTTNSSELAEALRRFRSHGIERYEDRPAWHYDVTTLGFNYRMTDIQAALGLSQLEKVDKFIERREALAQRYDEMLAHLPVVTPPRAPAGERHGRHLYPIQVADRDRVYDELRRHGIGTQVHYIPVYRHRLYAADGDAAHLPTTEEVWPRLLSLPLFPAMTESDQDAVVAALEAVL